MTDQNKKDLLSRWLAKSKTLKEDRSASSNEIKPLGIEDPRSLSSGQQRLWMLQQLNPENAFYNYAEVYQIKGDINVNIFEKSIQKVIERHDILRTTFERTGNTVSQVINDKMTFDFAFESHVENTNLDLNKAVLDFEKKYGGRAFDLAKGPLVNIGLLQLAKSSYTLIINMHHIITDKWSMRIFREELSEIYNESIRGNSTSSPKPELQYADFAHWEQNKEKNQKQLDYWLNKLEGAPQNLNLPFDYRRPQIPSHRGAFCKRKISKDLSTKVDAICKEHGTTHFVFYLSVFTILLRIYGCQKDLVIGTPISNRDKSSLERMIGFFNETIVLRLNIEDDFSFKNHLIEIRKTVLDAFTNKDIPLEFLIKKLGIERNISTNPLFQTMFLYHKVPEKPIWEGFEIDYETLDTGVSKFDLTMYVAEDEEGHAVTIEYATDLFKSASIERMQDCYALLLEQITSNPDISLDNLLLASKQEKEKIYSLHANDVTYPIDRGIHHYIINHLEHSPSAKSVTLGDKSLTYNELVRNAFKVAGKLKALGVNKGDVIPVCTNRSVDTVASILAVLIVGGVYMPLDPNYPKDRINYMIGETQSNFVICENDQLELFSDSIVNGISYCQLIAGDQPFEEHLDVAISSDDIAYLIFTSGSSGRPKGVSVTHGNIIHSTLARLNFYASAPSRFMLLSSFAFDSSMVGLFWTLCNGGELILTPNKIEQDMSALGDLISQHNISHTLMLPSLYQLVLEQNEHKKLDSLECVIVAGEACSSGLCENHFKKLPKTRLYNEYGPTEASVWCTGYELTKMDIGKVIPIGQAISSTDIFILDEYDRMVPRGVIGEINIGGRGITPGYYNRDDLTKEKFISHSFKQEFPSLLYQTGDLGKMRLDGTVEFLGRIDQQIKIRGFRVELSEIQTVLQSTSAFTEVITVAIKKNKGPNNSRMIVAYYVSPNEVDKGKLTLTLGEKLPDYMIPASFIKVDEIPKLPNGKYNYRLLESTEFISDNKTDEDSYLEPRNDIEKALVLIWQEVLGIDKVGIHDNFFALGGDSILSILINGKARGQGIVFPANEIFKSQTIAELAIHVDLVSNTQEEVSNYVGPLFLSPIQHWYFSKFKNAPNHWHLGVRFKLPNRLDLKHLNTAISIVYNRHETLRAMFYSSSNYSSKALPASEEVITVYNLDEGMPPATDEKIQAIINDMTKNQTLDTEPLFKCLYFNTNNGDQDEIVFLAHHLIIDQVSWQIIIEEITELLHDLRQEKKPRLPSKSISYSSWVNRFQKKEFLSLFIKAQNFWNDQFDLLSTSQPAIHNSTEKDVHRISVQLDFSQILLGALTNKLDAKPNEILISAVSKSLAELQNKTLVIVESEGHGREPFNESDSFHNSVGWFTSVFPVILSVEKGQNILSYFRHTKNTLRSIPDNGASFGVVKYILDEGKNKKKYDYYPEVVINYLGIINSLESSILGQGEMLKKGMRSLESERSHSLELNFYIKQEQLVVDCSYISSYTSKTINQLLNNIVSELKQLEKLADQYEGHNYVPADFIEVDIEEDDLDALFEQF